MTKRIVVALGGNAILTDDPSAAAQQQAIQQTAQQLINFLAAGDMQLVLTHGNGPQVGNLVLQQLQGSSVKNPAMPLDTVGAMTQGEIGLWLADALNYEISIRGLSQRVDTVLTRTIVDEADPAFRQPTKPIGPFYTVDELPAIKQQYPDWQFVADAGRGFRRVVPSPKPVSIMEAAEIQALVQDGVTLIAGGGGGVPVIEKEGHVTGIKEALFAVLLTNEFERVVIFNRVGYLYDLVKSDLVYPNVAAYYERIDDETWLTFWEYVQHLSSTKETACLMLVHPKTIVYRLNKICATTGLNPKQGVDLLPLIVTYVRKQTACFYNLVNELQSLSDSLLPRDKVD
ncbi:hypothetical protein D0509_04900 [Weissella cibaria]|uniref:amino acid kinase family protein n=1 Tax=Weissella cibaria TaxID=137591 RepID=UPI0021C2271F|nr:helix-turn-helix domain-containing protein [Weissella cibaria]MCT8401035.1 hypothetical protein [Weissella cibaria]